MTIWDVVACRSVRRESSVTKSRPSHFVTDDSRGEGGCDLRRQTIFGGLRGPRSVAPRSVRSQSSFVTDDSRGEGEQVAGRRSTVDGRRDAPGQVDVAVADTGTAGRIEAERVGPRTKRPAPARRHDTVSVSHPWRRTCTCLASIHPRPTHRPCSWCASEFAIACRPGRPRLYCNHACRQRAYEHRHGFEHRRTVRPLPARPAATLGQVPATSAAARIAPFGQDPRPAHQRATRRSPARDVVRRPGEADRRPALQRRCILGPVSTCTAVADSNPLRYGISASNELSRLRSLLDDIDEQRVAPDRRSQLDSGELSVTDGSGSAAFVRPAPHLGTNTCSR